MPTRDSHKTSSGARADDEIERRLLAEFLKSPSVVALAGAIAQRLGGRTRAEDLMAEAGLSRARVPLRGRQRG